MAKQQESKPVPKPNKERLRESNMPGHRNPPPPPPPKNDDNRGDKK